MARENQFKRRWDVLQVLQKHRFGVAIEDIISKMGCSRRSIERDLNTLKDVGFPIKCETRDHGKKFWSIERNFLSADKLLIEPTEVMGLYIAGQFLAPLNNTPYGEGLKTLLDKISKIMPKSAFNYFSALNETVYLKQTSGISSYGTEHIGTIQKAIDEKVIVQIEYQAPGKKDYTFNYHPYGFVILGNTTYTVGYSEYAKDDRTLKVQRMKDVKISKKKFEPPCDLSLEKRFKNTFGIIYSDDKPITFRCKFTSYAVQRIREEKWHTSQVIEKDNGDDLIASFLLNNAFEFKAWLMSFGSEVTVLEPLDFRKEVENSLKATLENYKS